MIDPRISGDDQFLAEIRRRRSVTVQDLCKAAGVTENAVRHRLNRLMGLGLVNRRQVRASRGRPYHEYRLTKKAGTLFGSNYRDLAVTLWSQIKRIHDRATRRLLGRSICDAMVDRYRTEIPSGDLSQRLSGLKEVMADQGVQLEIDSCRPLPIIRERDCPYAELAERDRGICALEKQVYQKLLGSRIRLARCCFDGHDCCEFEVASCSDAAHAV